MSAASPRRCREFATPPTAALSALHLYPLFTVIGLPHARLMGSRQWSIKYFKRFVSSGPGVLSIPRDFAVLECVSSSNVKNSAILSEDQEVTQTSEGGTDSVAENVDPVPRGEALRVLNVFHLRGEHRAYSGLPTESEGKNETTEDMKPSVRSQKPVNNFFHTFSLLS